MKNKFLPLLFALGAYGAYGQVGIGTAIPNSSSQLEVVATNKGVLIPRVPLTSTTDAVTITNGNINSLLVFNTATVADIKPGYYYWFDDRWNRIVISSDLTPSQANVIYNPITNEFTYIDNAGNIQVINFEEIVQANETVTTLADNNDGTYTYTSEDGTVTTINVPADVINNFEDIVSNTDVLNQLIEIIHQNGGNVFYDGSQFTYIDINGVTQVINIQDIVQANETVTTLADNNDGTYTYTSEDGTVTTINVPADVINNFEDIVSNTDVLNQLIEIIHQNGGNVFYDGSQFTYIDINGVTQVINIQDIVQANETVTTLTDNGDGTITYINEAGIPVTVNLATGPAGANGLSAYEIWINEGNMGTEQEFLDSLVGPQGVAGTDGADGNGIASTVDNGNGTFTITYTNGTTFTTSDLTGPQGVAGADGTDGADGADGNGIASTVDNGDGTFTITYTDGTTFTTSDLTGPQGVAGTDGADGNGIASTVDNGNGTFTITYTNGTTFTTSDLTGPQGVAGADGTDGADGADGNGIASTVDNGDGTFTITYTDGTTFTTSDLTGPQGVAGADGTDGTDGADGADGNGIASTVDNGDGTFTITYTNGTTFTTSDLTGPQGVAGADGTDGADGNGIASTVDNGDGTFTITYTNGTTFTTSDLTGPQGVAGADGPQGPAGDPATNINTTLALTSGVLVYVNEEANNPNVPLISADAANAIIAGTDGRLFVPEVAVNASNGTNIDGVSGDVKLGGPLTEATTITTTAALTLAVAGLQDGTTTDKIVVADATTGVLRVRDANASKVVKTAVDYTTLADDATILADASGAPVLVTLPAAASSTGRVIVIRKIDDTSNLLTFSETIKLNEVDDITGLNYNATIRIQSDGTDWYMID